MDKIDHVLAEIASIHGAAKGRQIDAGRVSALFGYLADNFTDEGLANATSDIFTVRPTFTAADLRGVPEGHAVVMIARMLLHRHWTHGVLGSEGMVRFMERFRAHLERIIAQERGEALAAVT